VIRSDKKKRGLLLLPILAAFIFFIAFYHDRCDINDHSTTLANFYKNIVALIGSVLTSVLVLTIVSEYTYSLYYLNQRLQLLDLLNSITHKNRAGKKNIYHFKLNTPENIISWYKIRKCLKVSICICSINILTYYSVIMANNLHFFKFIWQLSPYS
jgi:hypothetical protein